MFDANAPGKGESKQTGSEFGKKEGRMTIPEGRICARLRMGRERENAGKRKGAEGGEGSLFPYSDGRAFNKFLKCWEKGRKGESMKTTASRKGRNKEGRGKAQDDVSRTDTGQERRRLSNIGYGDGTSGKKREKKRTCWREKRKKKKRGKEASISTTQPEERNRAAQFTCDLARGRKGEKKKKAGENVSSLIRHKGETVSN